MSKMNQVYGIGQALILSLPPPVKFESAPTAAQDQFEVGQLAYTGTSGSYTFYLYEGAGVWTVVQTALNGVTSVSGTANQITATPTTGAVVLSIPSALTVPGSLTAASGNITATNGNFVKTAAGSKDVYTSVATTTTAGANSAGTVTLVGGTATISTTAIAAGSKVRLTRQSVGATGANPLGLLSVGTISAGASFVINAWSGASALALSTTDVSSIWWEIVN